jgi:FKBP-type peptidyl-prolyl cis-trans isomerase 2
MRRPIEELEADLDHERGKSRDLELRARGAYVTGARKLLGIVSAELFEAQRAAALEPGAQADGAVMALARLARRVQAEIGEG